MTQLSAEMFAFGTQQDMTQPDSISAAVTITDKRCGMQKGAVGGLRNSDALW